MMHEPELENSKKGHHRRIRARIPVHELKTAIPELLGEKFSRQGERHVEPAGAAFSGFHNVCTAVQMDVELSVRVPSTLQGREHMSPGIRPARRHASFDCIGAKNEVKGKKALRDCAAKQGIEWDRWDHENGDGSGSRVESFRADPAAEPDRGEWKAQCAIRLAAHRRRK